jgi:hypothetical protein
LSNVLTTLSGKFGDILWGMLTVREISKKHGPVDFAMMPQYRSLIGLLEEQPYVNKAFVVEDWACTGSPHSDQPWQPPKHCEEGYEVVYHLTPKRHVGMYGAPMIPLAHFMASEQNIVLTEPTIPFLTSAKNGIQKTDPPLVCYTFNPMHAELKARVVAHLVARNFFTLIDISGLSWLDAAAMVLTSGHFIGCRSACWVLALGLGATTWTYEPDQGRNAYGQWGKAFGIPGGKENAAAMNMVPEAAADWFAAGILKNLKEGE